MEDNFLISQDDTERLVRQFLNSASVFNHMREIEFNAAKSALAIVADEANKKNLNLVNQNILQSDLSAIYQSGNGFLHFRELLAFLGNNAELSVLDFIENTDL